MGPRAAQIHWKDRSLIILSEGLHVNLTLCFC